MLNDPAVLWELGLGAAILSLIALADEISLGKIIGNFLGVNDDQFTYQ